MQNLELYQLGMLPTETPHPDTHMLSQWAQENLSHAIHVVRKIDADALKVLAHCASEFIALERSIRDTLSKGHRVFLCGCGATGRLSLVLESLWRETHRDHSTADRLVGFMAGGDIALVRSVENFEDMPDFGKRHLESLGFKKGDLLISSTEGGETPFVIGATEASAQMAAEDPSHPKPWFLYCNPTQILHEHVERSRRVIDHPQISKISIPIGPMALSGSTRLQASTVLMLGIGICLFDHPKTPNDFQSRVEAFYSLIAHTSFDFLISFVREESEIIKRGDFLLYSTNRYGITILTDTTERSPTFSLRPFENTYEAERAQPCWSYLMIEGAQSSEEAWNSVLGRQPFGLEWNEFGEKLSRKMALGFDFSISVEERRRKLIAPHSLERFSIRDESGNMRFKLGPNEHVLNLPKETPLLFRHTLLKLILNIHSLLVMGRLGRYEHNIMTWVRPSNGKLVDRAIRYARHLLEKKAIHPSYDETARALYEITPTLRDDEPIVIKLIEKLSHEPRRAR